MGKFTQELEGADDGLFMEGVELINLDGDAQTAPTTLAAPVGEVRERNLTIAFVSLMSSYRQAGAQDPGYVLGEKIYSRFGGAFEFEVSTSFRDVNDVAAPPTDEEILIYESRQEAKRDDAMMYVFVALGATVVVVIFIFVCQSICSDHSQVEYQKRAMIYKKQDLTLRNTIK